MSRVRRSPTLTRARGQVLDALRTAGEPLTLERLSERTGSHPNTLRDHLAALIDEGLVASEVATEPGRRGRPAHRYVAVAPRRSDAEMLAIALAQEVADHPDASHIALRAGHRWGAELGDVAPDELLRKLAELGYEPMSVAEGIVLRACPLGEVAGIAPGVVCRMHLGALMEGLGEGLDVNLIPWGHSDGCLLTLAPQD